LQALQSNPEPNRFGLRFLAFLLDVGIRYQYPDFFDKSVRLSGYKTMDPLHLKKVGLKVTSQRMQVLDVLAQSSQRHLSAEDIYQHLRSNGHEASLTTIYRNLKRWGWSFGIILRVGFQSLSWMKASIMII
jgi:hypothetical protein